MMINHGFWLFGFAGLIIIGLSKKLIFLEYVLVLFLWMDLMALFEINWNSEIGGPGVQPFSTSTTLVVQILKIFPTQKYNLLCIDKDFNICYTICSQLRFFVKN
jgi:hypothetical protein